QDAEAAKEQAQTERDSARWFAYRAQLSVASSALERSEAAALRTALDLAPAEHREWEWALLDAQINRPLVQLRDPRSAAGPRYIFWPEGDRIAAGFFSTHLDIVPPIGVFSGTDGASTVSSIFEFGREGRRIELKGESVVSEDLRLCAVIDSQGEVVVTELESGNEVARLRLEKGRAVRFGCRGFDPQCRRVGFLSNRGFETWDFEAGTVNSYATDAIGQLFPPFSPDGRRLALLVHPKRIALYDLETTKRIATIGLEDRLTLSAAFSPDSRYLVTGENHPANGVRLWDVQTGELLAHLGDHRNTVIRIVYGPDGKTCVSCSSDGSAIVWDLETRTEKFRLEGQTSWVRGAAYSHHGDQLVTTSEDRTARLWDLATGETTAVFSHEQEVYGAAFSADDRQLATVGINGDVNLWNLSNVYSRRFQGHRSFVYDVAYSPLSDVVISGAWDGTVRQWSARGDPPETEVLWSEREDWILGLAVSRSGRLAAVAAVKKLVILELPSGRVLQSIAIPNPGWGTRFSVRPSFDPAESVVLLGNERFVRGWSVATGEKVVELPDHEDVPWFVDHSSDGHWMASAGGLLAIVWNAKTYERVQAFKHEREVHLSVFTPDASQLITFDSVLNLRVWDRESGEVLAERKQPSMVYSIAVHPDQTRLATGGHDGTVRILDLLTLDEVVGLSSHDDFVHGVAFDREGTKLFTASGDHSVRIWLSRDGERAR
ncbi:MAG: hypothetical protein AAF517_07560, partial [Planctomycetota bacterium]